MHRQDVLFALNFGHGLGETSGSPREESRKWATKDADSLTVKVKCLFHQANLFHLYSFSKKNLVFHLCKEKKIFKVPLLDFFLYFMICMRKMFLIYAIRKKVKLKKRKIKIFTQTKWKIHLPSYCLMLLRP